jgi:Flp pilus assembly pilin Flp
MQRPRSCKLWLRLPPQTRRFLADERGQAASEYVLVIGIISIPLFVAFEYLFKKFLHDFIAAVITSFTRG